MEITTAKFLEYGLLGALLVVAGIVIFRLYNTINDLNNKRIQDKDAELVRKEKDADQYISIIEKTMTALTAVEKSVFENSTQLPIKIVQSIQEANKPLIEEIKKVLDERRQAK